MERGTAKQPAPLPSNALHRSNRVSAEKITTGVLYIPLFAQSAVRQYTSQKVLADLPERYSVSVPPVTNNIYRSAVPAPKYLQERRSAAFRHHYSPVPSTEKMGTCYFYLSNVLGVSFTST